VGEKMGLKFVQTILSPKIKAVTTLRIMVKLCAWNILIKKNYSQTEAGKRYFINIYKQSIAKGDEKMIKFCKDILDIYNKHMINGHIKRPNGK
jgi:hypothetical protein